MENTVAICGANSINAITDIIHGYYCGKSDRLSLQLRLQDAIDQLQSVKKQLIIEDGELYKPAQFATEAGGDVTTKLSEIFNNAKEGDDIGIMAYNLGALDTITKAVDILETFRVTALKTKSHSGDFAENLFYQAIEEISGVAPDNVTPKNLVDVEEVIKVINDWWYASNPNKKDIIINNIRNINKR